MRRLTPGSRTKPLHLHPHQQAEGLVRSKIFPFKEPKLVTLFELPDDHPAADLPFTIHKRRGAKPRLSNEWKKEYQHAHETWFKGNTPAAYNDGHYTLPKFPDARKTNGITNVVVNYLTWAGHYANRISSTGRVIKTKHGESKYISGQTKRGTADVHCILAGKHCSLEVKNKYTKDTQSDDQVKEQQRITKAGGIYVIITCVEDFFDWYKGFV